MPTSLASALALCNPCLTAEKSASEVKLKRTPEILEEYDDIVKKQIADGVVEHVPQMPDGGSPGHSKGRRKYQTPNRVRFNCKVS
eukprot:gene6661-biopygen8160